MQSFLRANFKSRWVVIVYPILLFLGVLIGFPAWIYFGLEWQTSVWLVTAIVTGFVLALLISLTTYPIFLRVSRRQMGEIGLDGHDLLWKHNGYPRALHLDRPYRAWISAGQGYQGQPGVLVQFRRPQRQLDLYWSSVSCPDATQIFTEVDFIWELAVASPEGLLGFEMDGSQLLERELLDRLLCALWETRHNNLVYNVYESKKGGS